jgi:hypothetical protein
MFYKDGSFRPFTLAIDENFSKFCRFEPMEDVSKVSIRFKTTEETVVEAVIDVQEATNQSALLLTKGYMLFSEDDTLGDLPDFKELITSIQSTSPSRYRH